MISKQAGRAMDLVKGIEVCCQADTEFWMGVVNRIIVDMDEGADERGLCFIVNLLSDMWRKLPAKDAGHD